MSAPSTADLEQALSTFTSTALRSYATDQTQYIRLIQELNNSFSRNSQDALARWFRALGNNAALIDLDRMSALSTILMDPKYESSNDEKTKSQLMLWDKLTSARPQYIHLVIQSLIRGFLTDFLPTENEKIELIQNEIHLKLNQLIKRAPLSTSPLLNILISSFPHKRHSAHTLQMYIKNLLRIAESHPQLRDRLIKLIVERATDIDVELQNEYSNYFVIESIEPKDDEMTSKLDALLCLMFDYLSLLHSSHNTENLSDSVFASLLRVFDETIIHTHRSTHIQFLLFFICNFKQIYAESFLKAALERCFDRDLSPSIRETCMAYVGSFVCKASYLRRSSLIVAFEMLLSWCVKYAEFYEEHLDKEVGILEAAQHSIFYRAMQIVCYVFAYKAVVFREMMMDDPSLAQKLQFDLLLNNRLNPLRYIEKSIVQHFALTCRTLGVFDCSVLIDANHKFDKSTRSLRKEKQFQIFDPNDVYLPFGTFRLNLSSKYVQPLFEHYRPIVQTETSKRKKLHKESFDHTEHNSKRFYDLRPSSTDVSEEDERCCSDGEIERRNSSNIDDAHPPSHFSRRHSSDFHDAKLDLAFSPETRPHHFNASNSLVSSPNDHSTSESHSPHSPLNVEFIGSPADHSIIPDGAFEMPLMELPKSIGTHD